MLQPFHPHHYKSIKQAWAHSINEGCWRIGLVMNQGNGQNVTEDRVRERLCFIRKHLVRKIWGKRNASKGWIKFLVFQQGEEKSGNQHFHILVAVFGKHDWSDFRLVQEIKKFDLLGKMPKEKIVYTNHNLHSGNCYHAYDAREAYKTAEWGFLL